MQSAVVTEYKGFNMALTQELKEIYGNYENQEQVYEAIQLSHPNFAYTHDLFPADDLFPEDAQYPNIDAYGTSIFLIRANENKKFNVDGNETLFLAYPFGVIPPDVGDDNQDIRVVFDNVSRELIQSIEQAAVNAEEPIKMRFFMFIDSSVDTQITPIELRLTNITANLKTVQATGTRSDLYAFKFPTKSFDTRFKGLYL